MSTDAEVPSLYSIQIALARIEERQQAAQAAAEHRHNNMKMALDTFVPRREIEADNRSRDVRIDKLEANQHRAAWAIISAWLGGLVVVGSLLRGKLGVG